MPTPADYLRSKKALLEELQIKKDIGTATQAEIDRIIVLESAVARLSAKQKQRLASEKSSVDYAKKINVETAGQLSGLSSISGVYKSLADSQKASLKVAQQDLTNRIERYNASDAEATIMRDTLADVSKLNALQQQLAETGPEQVDLQNSIREQYEAQQTEILNSIANSRAMGQLTQAQAEALGRIVESQKENYQIAAKYATITAEQKELAEAQIEVYNGIKKSIRGVLATLSQLTSGPLGFLGTALIGAGFAADKLGANIRNFGGYVDSAQLSALGLSFIFKDAEETAKSLSKEFGGLKDVTFSTQLNTNLMATNMGISGQEAASVVGNFARMNEGSAATAMDMAATTKAMGKAAGVPIDSLMKDVAGSSKAFAEYGKDGGLNIAKAAVSAAKLGVGMDSLTKVTDSLLDFETSINAEMELGAMLGKQLNLDRARGLAYEGNIGGAVKETLQQLGGIEEFNKMDIFQKRKAAELLGLSVDELQKMAANSDKLNEDGSIQLSTFDSITESITAAATASGGFLKTMGGMVLGAAQMGGSFAQMGMDVKGMASKLPIIGKLFGGGAAPTAGPTPAAATTPSPGGGGADQANKFSKIKSSDLIKGAAALLILAAALWVSAKAFQEFAEVTWESVAKGLVGLVGLATIAYILGKAQGEMIKGAIAVAILGVALIPFAFAMSLIAGLDIGSVLAAAAGLVIFGAAIFALGALMFTGVGALVFGAGLLALAGLGAALMLLGAGLVLVGSGFSAISGSLPAIMEQVAAVSQIDYMPIIGLAGALTLLAGALALVAISGMLALPALMALGLVAGGAAMLFGGGEGGDKGDRTGELIDEIKGLRADLSAGKISVHMDGQKVTSRVSAIVDKGSSNSYGKR
jgi:hypothetical protein